MELAKLSARIDEFRPHLLLGAIFLTGCGLGYAYSEQTYNRYGAALEDYEKQIANLKDENASLKHTLSENSQARVNAAKHDSVEKGLMVSSSSTSPLKIGDDYHRKPVVLNQ